MNTKSRVTYTIKTKTHNEMHEYAKKHAINMSALVDLLINEWLVKQKHKINGREKI